MTDLAIKPGAGTTPSAAPLQALKVETLAVRMRRRKRLVLALRLGLPTPELALIDVSSRFGRSEPDPLTLTRRALNPRSARSRAFSAASPGSVA